MKLVFASDSFKGSLSSARIGELLEIAAHEAFPDAECVTFPIADGGEGTLDAISSAQVGARTSACESRCENEHPSAQADEQESERASERFSTLVGRRPDAQNCEFETFPAHDGLMRPAEGKALLFGDKAFVEAASTCGLSQLSPSERNPLATTSYGLGECIRFALDAGCAEVTIGLGGSCTNDGGMGCLRALGVKFFDSEGRELSGRGADLASVSRIDESNLHPRVHDVSFTIMSDVENPLLGPNGATYVFGPQKGADSQTLEQLEGGMRNFSKVIVVSHPGVDFSTEGFGAAGGLGMALSVFLGAKMRSGIEELLRLLDFDAALDSARLVITGEGKLDSQSLQGKVISGIVSHARRSGVPVAVICGKSDLDERQLREFGLSHVLETGRGQTLEHAMAHAEENYLRTARELFAALT